MAITDINISEELQTDIPSIKYRGNEGPKSPKEEMKMAGPDRYFKILEFMLNELEGELGRELTDEEYEEVGRRAMDEFNQSRGPVLPNDPTKPINPFGPKPQGPVLPDRMMAGTDTPDIELEMLQELLESFREKFNRDPVSIDELKRATDQMRTKAAYGGIIGLDGRRRYGLGSKFKKFIRKVIPNELSSIAVKAAPFIAPFNPLAAGIASGLGSFDQTGSISKGLKSGLMNYGMGQLARGIGGGMDNLQGNPFKAKSFGEAFRVPRSLPGGEVLLDDSTFKTYFNSPIQEGGGLGEIFSNKKNPSKFSKITEGTLSDPREKLDFIKNTKADNLSLLDKAKDFAMNNKLATFLLAKEGFDLLGSPDQAVNEIMSRGKGLDLDSIRAEVQEAFADSSGEKLKALRVKYPYLGRADTKLVANGGRIGRAEGGIMDLGGMEKDYRAEGGFVPIGKEEKADDVPARLSVNEFVFTADAVRNAGGGDIDKGAEIMENMMKHLEQGGQVSEESQGMAGAQQMFETSERLSEVI